MLHSYDAEDNEEDNNESNPKKKHLLNGKKKLATHTSSEESDDDDDEMKGLVVNKQNGSSGKLAEDLVLNTKYPQLTKNIFI